MITRRRKFLKQCALFSTGTLFCGTSLLMQNCAGYRELIYSKKENLITIKKSQFKDFKNGVVELTLLPAAIFVNLGVDGTWTAVLLECTHKGCELSPSGNVLICPCHGSEFSMEGNVLGPPAEKNLYQFKVAQDANNIYINLE
jgi:cytochrome b6-f complex iron-sulfur subunit